MAKYKDWRKFDPLTMRNEQIRNTPETARGGYSALAPVETVGATVPKLASDTPEWAKRTPTEQARVNAAQARSQAVATPQGYTALAPATAPVSPYAVPESPYNYGAPKVETATKPASVPTTVTKTETPATGETEATGYAKYLAQNHELAEADRRAEAEYARALPTYGALAERMAQAGIHGGYSDYLQGVAYAKMQDAKQQNEEAAREGYAALTGNGGVEGATNAQIGAMYEMFGKGGYTDEEGNEVQGYGLLNLSDDADYESAKSVAREDAIRRGADSASVDAALADVDEMRKQLATAKKARIKALADDIALGIKDSDTLLEMYGVSVTGDPNTDSDNLKKTLKKAVKNEDISTEQCSKIVKSNLPIYDENPTDNAIYISVKTAIDDNQQGLMNEQDKAAVIEEAIKQISRFAGVTVTVENGAISYNGTASKGYAYYKYKHAVNDHYPYEATLELIAEDQKEQKR